MRILPLLILLLAVSAFAESPTVDAVLQKEYPSLEALYKQLHQNPELSYNEVKTSARIADELQKLGFEVTREFGHFQNPKIVAHGIVAVMKNGKGPTVLVRTELDALPVEEKTQLPYASTAMGKNDAGEDVHLMHACGHDIHMTVFIGTARALSAMRDRWKGTLIMIGQPSEERGPGGAEALLNGGLYTKFPKPDYCLALHDSATLEAGKVGWVEGYAAAAADSTDILLHGAGGHGAAPETTKDPVVMAAELVMALQSIVAREIPPGKPAVVTVGTLNAGTKRNIIPDQAKLELTVRSYEGTVRQKLLSSIQRIAKGVAEAHGGTVDIDLHPEEYYPSTYNNPDLVKRTIPAIQAAIGADNVVEVSPIMAAEDFSRYSLEDHSIPSFQFSLGAVDPVKMAESKKSGTQLPSLHSSLFAPLPEPTIRTGVKAMTAAVINLMK